MAWKESCRVDERMKFVTRLDGGERMTDLCVEFGISRKTGYKIWNRYEELGARGIFDQSRRPHHLARQTRADIQEMIVAVKRQHINWGASKVRDYLERNHPKIKFPVRATVHAVLDKHGLVKPRRKKRAAKIYPGFLGLTEGVHPNLVWATDYKGQFKMKNSQYCYPLTITDHYSRFILGCEAMGNTQTESAMRAFAEIFQEYGLPEIIRSDNGCPFASVGLLGLSRLSVWWIKLGIRVEHIQPGHPEQNGRHERMHLTLKQELKLGINLLQQQELLNEFTQTYNYDRAHEGVNMKRPAELYQPSARKLPQFIEPLEYPNHEFTKKVDTMGRILMPKTQDRITLTAALAGEYVGISADEDEIFRVTFKDIDLGFYDTREKRFSPSQELPK